MISSLGSLLVPSFIKRRYAAKFVVSILFVLLAIGIVGAAGYVDVNDTIEEDTRNSLESQATMQADSLAEWTQRMGAQSQTVAQIEQVNEGDSSEASNALDIAVSRGLTRGAAGIHVVNLEDGEIVASTTGSAIDPGTPLSEIEDPWATEALDGELGNDDVWVSDGSYDSQAVQGRTVVAFATRAENDSRAVVLEGSADVRLAQLHQGGVNQTTTIVNGDGDYVLRPENGEDLHFDEDAHHATLVSSALGAGDGSRGVEFSPHGGHLHAYAPVDGVGQSSDWVAITSAPENDAYAVRDTVARNVILIIASGILTLSLMGLVLGRQTVTPLTRLRSRARSMENGDLDVDLETERTDEIGQLYRAFDSMRRSLREQIRNAQSARDEAQAERERVRQINEELEHTAANYSTVMEQAAAGDLTARMGTDTENEAMAAIALDFNDMLEELEQTVAELNAFAAEVATASEQVTASSEEVRSASEQISESVQEISAGAERQNDSLQTVNREMSDLSTTTEEIAASSNEVADIAERTATTGQTGREAAQAAVEEMRSVEGESSRAVEEISQLESEVAQIDDLIDRIQDIADQTNMLALNANIEASRSATGDDDGGFGVVAAEVKELSQDAKDAASEVEERLEGIREQTRRSAEEVEQTSEDVQSASRQVEAAVEALEEIATFAEETHTGVQEISAATEQQAASTQEVVSMVTEATSISEETTAEAENVAAAAEEQTTALTEVSHSASDLSEQAARLSEALDRFETDAKLESGPEMRMLEGDGAAGPAGPGATGDQPEPTGNQSDPADEPASDELEPAPAPEEDIDAFDPEHDADAFGTDSAAGDAPDEGGDEPDEETDGGTDVLTSGDRTRPASGRSATPEPKDRTGADVFDAAAEPGGRPATDGPHHTVRTDEGVDEEIRETIEDATRDADAVAADVETERGSAEPVDDTERPTDEFERQGDDCERGASAGRPEDGVEQPADDAGVESAGREDGTGDEDAGNDHATDEGAGNDHATDEGAADLTSIHGVGTAKAESLREAGFRTVADVRGATVAELTEVSGFGEALASQVKDDVAE